MPSDMNKDFEYLEHTADAKFRAYGKSLGEAFENAALAMLNVMVETDSINNSSSVDVELSSPDADALLFDWLSEILFLFEVEEMVFGGVKVNELEISDEGCTLSATLSGEAIDLSVHVFDTEVKAATYNDMKIEQVDDGWMIQATVDT
ncbi:archease [Methanolobus profundi]|uniref:Protein archease n=1 Tax=Methanolobus profundi TaxID=487685 RepID=A0A1I4UGL2_9EURY|nr:archease [Methanolobus profundi]SFM88112.1 SHS2 domain-containing protein [Methanolobus profundi]